MIHDREKLSNLSNSGLLEWRLNLLFPHQESEYVEPFHIRGHHLALYFNLYKGKTPYQIVEDIIDNKQAKELLGDWYQEDLIGNTNRDKFIFTTLAQHQFETFIKLKRETLVILDSHKDDICNNCKVGWHCSSGGALGELEDSQFIASLVRHAEESGFDVQNKIKINTRYLDLHVSALANNFTPVGIGILTSKEVLHYMLTLYAKSHSTIIELSDTISGWPDRTESHYREFVKRYGARI